MSSPFLLVMCDICVFQIKVNLRVVLVDVSIKFMLAFVDYESFNSCIESVYS